MGFSAVARAGVLFEDERLRIRFDEGDTDREAVVSFAGIGAGAYGVRELRGRSHPRAEDPNPTQIDEFRKSIGGKKNVYYVTDKQRFWYNGLESRILDTINPHLAQRGTKRVLALGNSMGGSAVLMLASRIRECRHAVAMVPQSSVHPDYAPFESRWEGFRSKITDWTTPDPVAAMEGDTRRYYVFYGMDDPRDEQHIQRILARGLPNVIIFGIENCGHEVAHYLRDHGAPLTDIIERATGGRPNDVRDVFRKLPHKVFRAGMDS